MKKKYILLIAAAMATVLIVYLVLNESKEDKNAKAVAKLEKVKQVPQEVEIDVSEIVPGGFQGDSNLAKANANATYSAAVKFWDMSASRYRKPDSVIYFAAMSNYFSPNCQAYNVLGQVYVQKGKMEKGLEQYNKAVELDPNQGEPYFNRGTAFYILGNLPAACENWNKASELGVQNAASALGMYCN